MNFIYNFKTGVTLLNINFNNISRINNKDLDFEIN